MENEDFFESLVKICSSIKRLKMFPYFYVSHYILMCLLVREDNYPSPISGIKGFSRTHPLSSWFGSMLLCFAANIISNFLLGDPIIMIFKDETYLIVASITWFLVNYSPFDFVYKLVNITLIRIILIILQEMLRLNNIYNSIIFALHNFPGSLIFVVIFATVKGSAGMQIRLIQRVLCGIWLPLSTEILKPSAIVKGSLLVSIVFVLEKKAFIDIEESILYISAALFLFFIRFLWSFFSIDLFSLLEKFICFIFFGGLFGMFNACQDQVISSVDQQNLINKNTASKTKVE